MNFEKAETLIDTDALGFKLDTPSDFNSYLSRSIRARILREKILMIVFKILTIESFMIFLLAGMAL